MNALNSDWWEKRIEEDEEQFLIRKEDARRKYKAQYNKRGHLIFDVHYPPSVEITTKWYYEDDKKGYLDSHGTCKVCGNSRLMRVFNPDFHNGFMDKGGALAPCVCIRSGLAK